ncbi:MAG: hypothetical protein WC223_11425, partial [Bacteroidales bacterium]
MNLIKLLIGKSCLILIFLCIPYFIKAINNSHNSLNYANSLFLAGKYRDASIEYEKIIFESNDNIVRASAYLGRARSMKQLNQFGKAAQCLERVDYASITDSLHYLIRYENALCSYLSGNFENAESQFIQMNYFLKDTLLIQKSFLLQILTYDELQKWNESKNIAYKYISSLKLSPESKDSLSKIINEIYEYRNIPKLRNPVKAKTLSYIFPGLGHIYAGYPLEGIVSITLQGAAVTIGFYAIYYKYYITA